MRKRPPSTPPDGPATPPPVYVQVGLALRADRRLRELSQRDYARAREITRTTLARAEVDASALRMETVVRLLEDTGYELTVRPVTGSQPEQWWDRTDVEARTRDGRRFPANRKVSESLGPNWWFHHEVLGGGKCGPAPRWSAEGFTPPEVVRYIRSQPLADDETNGHGDS